MGERVNSSFWTNVDSNPPAAREAEGSFDWLWSTESNFAEDRQTGDNVCPTRFNIRDFSGENRQLLDHFKILD
jgi:hypothetical protein